MSLKNDRYTYRITWSEDDSEYVGLCAEFPSLSWQSKTPEAALKGIRKVVAEIVDDMQRASEPIPAAIAGKHYSGKFMVRDSTGSSSKTCYPGSRAWCQFLPPLKLIHILHT